MSAKTGSVHVSNILAKLRVSSRGEAAAAAHRLRLFDPGAEGAGGSGVKPPPRRHAVDQGYFEFSLPKEERSIAHVEVPV